jgi:hypothetical protein
MTKRTARKKEYEVSSGNVFADLGLPDAEQLLIESVQLIERTLTNRRLDAVRRIDALQKSAELDSTV